MPAHIARGEDNEREITRLIKCIFQCKTNINKNHTGVVNTETTSSKALSEIIQHISIILY